MNMLIRTRTREYADVKSTLKKLSKPVKDCFVDDKQKITSRKQIKSLNKIYRQ